MAKVQQKSEKISAFGGIFFVLDRFDRILWGFAVSLLAIKARDNSGRLLRRSWGRNDPMILSPTTGYRPLPFSSGSSSG